MEKPDTNDKTLPEEGCIFWVISRLIKIIKHNILPFFFQTYKSISSFLLGYFFFYRIFPEPAPSIFQPIYPFQISVPHTAGKSNKQIMLWAELIKKTSKNKCFLRSVYLNPVKPGLYFYNFISNSSIRCHQTQPVFCLLYHSRSFPDKDFSHGCGVKQS